MGENEEKNWIIRSCSEIGVAYRVSRINDSFHCTCPDFQFRGHQCKHIKKVMMQLAGKKQKNKLLEVES